MEPRPVTPADWRALVDRELAGASFDKVLVHEAFPGVTVAPLYVEGPAPDPAVRHERADTFRICMRHAAGAAVDAVLDDAVNGADVVWVPLGMALSGTLGREELAGTAFLLEAEEVPSPEMAARIVDAHARGRVAFGVDPIAWRAEGRAPLSSLDADLRALARLAASAKDAGRRGPSVTVSTLPYHDAGADAAEEIALALSIGARYVETLLDAGLSPDAAGEAIGLRTTAGRDTFLEVCKLRALRLCWARVLSAFGAAAAPAQVHAVSSSPALTIRDPWVNMLRVTTQVFAAVVGGADLVTPAAFDQAFGVPSAMGRRVARNTGLVLREESALGKVSDPAGGAYAFETLTDAIAREAWSRFRRLSKEGGAVAAIESGRLAAGLEAAWHARFRRIATRALPVLGVSAFANLDEQLPRDVPPAEGAAAGLADASAPDGSSAATSAALPAHRDAASFEALRLRADAMHPAPEVLLIALGTFAESRARVAFSTSLFAAGGLRTRETETDEAAPIACLCGTDERYGEEAADRARALKAIGVQRVLVAGRPRAAEAALREAGVDGFVFAGCDAVQVLSELMDVLGGTSGEAR